MICWLVESISRTLCRITKHVSVAFFVIGVTLPVISLAQVAKNTSKVIHVKFKEEFSPKLALSGTSARSGVGEMDKISDKHKALSIRRIFPDAGKYEKAHRAFGLHLWYEIKLPVSASLDHVLTDYRNLDYFSKVEERKEYATVDESRNMINLPELSSGTNDPQFNRQWHYNNTGQTNGTPGADVNLLKAWQIETGSPNVIVAVIDGGVYQNHPDLAGALWTNANEIPGNRIDDDKNGYVDDIHGYGFGDKSSTIAPDGHGTHVAGIIGAISNNGIGVSGIAGGSGSADGVRLMSCAGFGAFGIGGFEEAMVYAADNGAVISQNSWGGGSSAIEAAIDYFVGRAGYDNSAENFSSNIQTGPMAGGLVIFAAGNANTDDPRYGYPGSYEKCISVGSTDHLDRRSSFSNYGNWVDIAAPGSNVYSTIASSNYGALSGTSMACPHVSGVAALVVSHIQRKGLKPSEVWNRLRLSARPIVSDYTLPSFRAHVGRVDAFGALHEPDAIPPGAITDLHVAELNYASVVLQWTASGEDGASGQAAEYEIRYSTSPITPENFSNATLFPNPPTPPPAGQQVTAELVNLSLETAYYFAVRSKDLFNNVSPLSNMVNVTTLSPPTPNVITTEITEQLYSGGTSTKEVLIRNTGGDELLVRIGTPQLDPASVGFPTGSKGRLFAIHPLTNTIKEVDSRNGAVIASIPLPQVSTKYSEGLAFDGENLFYGSRSKIFKINATTGEVIRSFTINGLDDITGLAWSGRHLYVSDRSDRTTYEVDSDNGTIRKTFMSGHAGIISFGGNAGTLFVSQTESIDEIDLATGSVIRSIHHSLGEDIRAIAYSSLDQAIFISDASGQLRAIDAVTGGLEYVLTSFATTALASDEYIPGWITINDEITTIQPGATSSIPITFVATDLPTGQWSGTLKVIPVNIASNPISISATLNVTSAPDIETAREIDFRTRYMGFTIDTLISLENRGSSDLIITSIQSNDYKVTCSMTSASLAPGQKVPLAVTILSTFAGEINATITFSSNDPDEGLLTLPVKVTIALPPAIEIIPGSLSTTLSTGENKTLSFMAKNTGSSTLHWTTGFAGTSGPGISPSSLSQSKTAESDPMKPSSAGDFKVLKSSPAALTWLAADPESGNIYGKALAGNDFYRYSVENDSWTLLSGAPSNSLSQGAWLDGKLYYGGSQLTVYTIQSNSWTTSAFPFPGETGNLTSDGQYIYLVVDASLYRYSPSGNSWLQLQSLPRTIGGPNGGLSYHNGVIYAHEDETTGVTGDGRSYLFKYYLSSDTWITTIDSPKPSSGSAIDPAGRKYFVVGGIRMSILDMNEGVWKNLEAPFSTGSMSGLVYVGKPGFSGIYFIQGSDGTGFCKYETSSFSNWISVTPSKGELAAGATQTFSVVVDAKGIDDGIYFANLKVQSEQPPIESGIPLTVTVNGAPDIVLQPTIVDVGEVYLGNERVFSFIVKNTGSATLSVSSITVDRPDFKVSIPSFMIPTGESQDVNVSFTPSSIGLQTGTFTLVTNDPDESIVQFAYNGKGVAPPIAGITPSSLSVALLSGSTIVRQLTLSNTGGSNLEYGVDFLGVTWLKGDTYGILAPGGTRTIDVTIDASGKSAGTYAGKVRVTGRGQDLAEVPVTMTVTAATDILTSKKSIDFGDQFINGEYDSIIQIKNNGVLPLAITSINSNNPAFSVSVEAPLNLPAGQSIDGIVRFRPTNLSQQNGQITFVSDDPDEGIYVVPIAGKGIDPPVLNTADTLAATAGTNESQTLDLILTNSGGSTLKWRIQELSSPEPSSLDGSTGREQPMAAGDFTLLAPGPPSLKGLIAKPSTNLIYAFDTHYRQVYRFNTTNGYWNAAGHTPDLSGLGDGSGVFLGSKIYLVHTNNATTINVYTSTINDWTTIPNGLGTGTGMITTDGTLLYLAGGGQFKSLDPETGTWTELPIPTISLNGSGGLSYLDGAIYAHEGNGKGFAKYSIATQSWENLVPLPGDGMMGSAIDPIRRRYFAYAKNGSSYLYEYDITSNLWNIVTIPSFEIGNGGIAYSNASDIHGIYILQGSTGQAFVRYEPRNELTWLRASSLSGEISPSGSQGIGVNFNAYGLPPGLYRGSLEVSSNERHSNTKSIPVSFHVTTPPAIEVTEKLTVKVDRLDLHSVQLTIQNKGERILKWNFTKALASVLKANKVAGEIGPLTAEDVQITFDPTALAPGTYIYVVDINSNDPVHKDTWTVLEFIVVDNHAPVVSLGIADQKLGVTSVQLPLTGTISDPDNDPLIFSAVSGNGSIITTEVTGQMLNLHPVATGATTVTITAHDIFDLSASFTFDVTVDMVVAVEEFGRVSSFVAIPNPFQQEVTLRYHSETSGEAELLILDTSGKVVWRSGKYPEAPGNNEVVVNSIQFRAGIYTCHLVRGGDIVRSIRLAKY